MNKFPIKILLLVLLSCINVIADDKARLIDQLDEAQDNLERLIDNNETVDRVNGYISVALIYAKLEQMRTAVTYWLDAIDFADTLENSSLKEQTRWQYAKFLMSYQAWRRAQEVLDEINERNMLQNDTQKVQWHLMYIRITHETGRSEYAIQKLQLLLKNTILINAEPSAELNARQLLGELYFANNLYAKSVATYLELIQNPTFKNIFSFEEQTYIVLSLSKVYRAIEDHENSYKLLKMQLNLLVTLRLHLTEKLSYVSLMREIAFDLINLEEFEEAELQLNSALSVLKGINTREKDIALAKVHFWLGELHLKRNQEIQAKLFFEQTLNVLSVENDNELEIKTLLRLGQILFDNTQSIDKATQFFKKANQLSRESQFDFYLLQSLDYLSEIAATKKIYEEAYRLRDQFFLVKRRLDLSEDRHQTMKISAPLEQKIFELNQQIMSKDKTNKMLRVELKKQKLNFNFNVLLLIVTVLLIIFIAILYQRHLKIRIDKNKKNLTLTKKKLEELSFKDPLTGCANKAVAVNVLSDAKKRADRELLPLSIAFIRLINLEQFKERWGQETSDFAIVAFCQHIKNNIGEKDTVARWSHDTFMLILPNSPIENSTNTVTAIKQFNASIVIDYFDDEQNAMKKNDLKVTTGVSRYLPRRN
ncbi:MAG: diguanylate cyclase, partial [Pseudomonadota bacterium]